jgi:hypothetical protein
VCWEHCCFCCFGCCTCTLTVVAHICNTDIKLVPSSG